MENIFNFVSKIVKISSIIIEAVNQILEIMMSDNVCLSC